jgi:eukaryotic-like serine/threonine-protein kinase
MAISKQKWQVYEFDNFRVDAGRRRLERDGKPVPLPSKAFDLLLALVENNGRLVEKEELYQSVWADQVVEESNLTVQMSAIRKALGERRDNPHYIITIPGRGYRFVGEVHQTDEELLVESYSFAKVVVEKEETTDVELKSAAHTAHHTPIKQFVNRRSVVFGSLVAVLILGIGGYFWWQASRKSKQPLAITAFQSVSLKRLTTSGKVTIAALSPSGNFFAYASTERGSSQNSLWFGQVDGSKEIPLRPAEEVVYRGLAFSADEKNLYYAVRSAQSPQGALFKLPVLGGVPQKLLDNVNAPFALSPDQKQIAFVRLNRETRTTALLVANLDGAGEREIAIAPANKMFVGTSPAWSADGELIALSVINTSAEKGCEIFIVRVADGEAKPLAKRFEIVGLVWLKDKSGLIVAASDSNVAVGHQLWAIDYPEGNARQISRDLSDYTLWMSISTDSASLLTVPTQWESNFWIAPADNLAAARQFTFGSEGRIDGLFGFDWTPEGKIVYTAAARQSLPLWMMDEGGGNVRQITPLGFDDRNPNVSADGRSIVFWSNRSGAAEVWRADIDGGNLRQLTTGGNNLLPQFTPDGKWLVYWSTQNGVATVSRMPSEGGESVRLTEKEAIFPRLSPDGKSVACGYAAEAGKPMKLAVIRVEDGHIVKLFDVPPTVSFIDSVRWTRDGNAVVYLDRASGIWRQAINGGRPERIEGLPGEEIFNYEWSRDGKLFAYTRGREISDVVLIKNSE